MLTAITRDVSPSMNQCELTFLDRTEIDIAQAREEHRSYERSLAEMGAKVISLPAEPDLPDSVFVEDCAIVLDEVAILTHPGALSRRAELPSIAKALEPYRQLRRITEPGTLEGGDVMCIGRTLYVGVSGRTNLAGIAQLSEHVREFDYEVVPVTVHGCLHLKSAVCSLGHEHLLANRDWADLKPMASFAIVDVAPEEPWAANVLAIGNTVLMPSGFPATAARITDRGRRVRTVNIAELRKAEAGVTCSSLIFQS